jgi:hypothetical protein
MVWWWVDKGTFYLGICLRFRIRGRPSSRCRCCYWWALRSDVNLFIVFIFIISGWVGKRSTKNMLIIKLVILSPFINQ